MVELLRSNDPVLISFVCVLLRQAGLDHVVLDGNMSVMEGSLGVLPRRIMVRDRSVDEARKLMSEAGIGAHMPGVGTGKRHGDEY